MNIIYMPEIISQVIFFLLFFFFGVLDITKNCGDEHLKLSKHPIIHLVALWSGERVSRHKTSTATLDECNTCVYCRTT